VTRTVSYFDQAEFDIRCEWGLQGVKQVANSDEIIVVDVLSFTTSVDIAASRGATIFPYRWKDETATTYAKERGAEVANSRSRFEGRFSLAPSSLVEIPSGFRLVLPSPNGSSLAFEAMSTGSIVAAAPVTASAEQRVSESSSGSSCDVSKTDRFDPRGGFSKTCTFDGSILAQFSLKLTMELFLSDWRQKNDGFPWRDLMGWKESG
jgi:hypothetical protein